MNNISSAISLSASVRVYRALLVAYPSKFRAHYETHMVQVFRDSIREAHHHNGIPGVVDLWIHTLFDLVFTALIQRISERSQVMFSPKVVLWGGAAGAINGFMWFMTGIAPSGGGVTIVLALILGLGGLAGLYSLQAERGRKLGLLGFVLGIIGTVVLLAGIGSYSTSEAQSILIDSSGLTVLGIGLGLLGITSLQMKTLHRLRGLPMVMGLLYLFLAGAFWKVFYVPFSHGQDPWHPWNPPAYLPVFGGFAVLGLCWIVLGFMLMNEAGNLTVPSAQASG